MFIIRYLRILFGKKEIWCNVWFLNMKKQEIFLAKGDKFYGGELIELLENNLPLEHDGYGSLQTKQNIKIIAMNFRSTFKIKCNRCGNLFSPKELKKGLCLECRLNKRL